MHWLILRVISHNVSTLLVYWLLGNFLGWKKILFTWDWLSKKGTKIYHKKMFSLIRRKLWHNLFFHGYIFWYFMRGWLACAVTLTEDDVLWGVIIDYVIVYEIENRRTIRCTNNWENRISVRLHEIWFSSLPFVCYFYAIF